MIKPTLPKPVFARLKVQEKRTNESIRADKDFQSRLKELQSINDKGGDERGDDILNKGTVYETDALPSAEGTRNLSKAKTIKKPVQPETDITLSTTAAAQATFPTNLNQALNASLATKNIELRSGIKTQAFDATTHLLIHKMEAISQKELSSKNEWRIQQVGENHVLASIHLQKLETGAWAMSVHLPNLQSHARDQAAQELKQRLTKRGHEVQSVVLEVGDDDAQR